MEAVRLLERALMSVGDDRICLAIRHSTGVSAGIKTSLDLGRPRLF